MEHGLQGLLLVLLKSSGSFHGILLLAFFATKKITCRFFNDCSLPPTPTPHHLSLSAPQTHPNYAISFPLLISTLSSYDSPSPFLFLVVLLVLRQKKKFRESESNMSSTQEAFLDTRPDATLPPPGIEANFNAPNTNGTAIIIVAVIGIFLATFITAVRIYTKGILTRSLGWDDCKDFPLFCLHLSATSLPPKRQRKQGGKV